MSRRRVLQTLTTLDLSSNQLGAAGGEHLADALGVNEVRRPLKGETADLVLPGFKGFMRFSSYSKDSDRIFGLRSYSLNRSGTPRIATVLPYME